MCKKICLSVFDSFDTLKMHKDWCRMSPAYSPMSRFNMQNMGAVCYYAINRDGVFVKKYVQPETEISNLSMDIDNEQATRVIAMDCEMVGGWWKYELTGIIEDHLVDAMPLMEVTKKVEEILYNGESLWRVRLEGYSKVPSIDENKSDQLFSEVPNWDIFGASDIHTLRVYKRMRSQKHQEDRSLPSRTSNETDYMNKINSFDPTRMKELEKMSPDDPLEMSPDCKKQSSSRM
ncbi:uncharacterized protein [Typha angustifolia]|uniref:uncharacterized protein n=1 Tax=Typha angustifolia TaxID=59011 RepID=UPI003C2FA95F